MTDEKPTTTNDESEAVEQTQKQKKPRGRPRKPTPPPKPPKQKKPSLYNDNRAEWFRQYYREKLLKKCTCENCGAEFCSEANLRRHENRHKGCMIIKLQRHITLCKQDPVEDPLDAGIEMSEETPPALIQD